MTPPLRVTWLALLVAIYALLTAAPTIELTGPRERVVLAPAIWLMELYHGLRGWIHPASFPLFAALQWMALGLALDAARILRWARAGRPSSPDPLRPFKACLVVAFAAALFGAVAGRDLERRMFDLDPEMNAATMRRHAGLIARGLEEVRSKDPEALRVLVLGDSMMGSALAPERPLEKRLRGMLGRPVTFSRITLGGLELVEMEPVLDELLELRADLLVIDANLLFGKARNLLTRRSFGRPTRWANAALDHVERALAALGVSPREGAQYTPADLPADLGELRGQQDDRELDIRDRWLGRHASAHDPNYVFARTLLTELGRRGLAACFTTVPVSDILQPLVEAFLDDSRRLTRELAQETGVELLAFEPYAPDDWFLDTVHMNSTSMPKYSAWLVNQLARLLKSEHFAR